MISQLYHSKVDMSHVVLSLEDKKDREDETGQMYTSRCFSVVAAITQLDVHHLISNVQMWHSSV